MSLCRCLIERAHWKAAVRGSFRTEATARPFRRHRAAPCPPCPLIGSQRLLPCHSCCPHKLPQRPAVTPSTGALDRRRQRPEAAAAAMATGVSAGHVRGPASGPAEAPACRSERAHARSPPHRRSLARRRPRASPASSWCSWATVARVRRAAGAPVRFLKRRRGRQGAPVAPQPPPGRGAGRHFSATGDPGGRATAGAGPGAVGMCSVRRAPRRLRRIARAQTAPAPSLCRQDHLRQAPLDRRVREEV